MITIEDLTSQFGAYIRNLIRQLQETKQVDVIAHSMGGLIVRAWMAGEINAAVPYNGEIRRLVLIATPNYGADGTKLGVVANVFGLPTSLLKEMNFSSEFIAGLDEKWQEAQLDPKRRIALENLLLIAGTVGTIPFPGLSCSECDGVVEGASAALPDISLNNMRYVPYKHAEPILPINAPTVIDNKSLNPAKHGTYTFVSEFLATGTIISQSSIDYNPGRLSNALLFVVPFDQGTGQKLSGKIVRLTFRLPGGLNVNPQPQTRTNSAAGVVTAWDVDTRLNPYIVNVQVPSYCSKDEQISLPAAVPTVLNVTFVPRALVHKCP